MGKFVAAAKKSELTLGCPKRVSAGGRDIVLCYVEDKIYALADECPHAGAPLSDGDLDGTKLTCPWHGAQFDVTNGQLLAPPAMDGIRSFAVKIEGDEILVEID